MRTSRASRREVTERAVGEGRMSCCGANPGYDELDEVSAPGRRQSSPRFCARCATTASRSGLREGQDAAALMAGGLCATARRCCARPSSICSRRARSDWEKFDGLFDAFWLGKRVRSRSVTTGSAKAANSPSLKSLQDDRPARRRRRPRPTRSRPPTMRRRDRGGEGRMEGASRADNLAEIDFRKLADPARDRAGPCRRGAAGAKPCARG